MNPRDGHRTGSTRQSSTPAAEAAMPQPPLDLALNYRPRLPRRLDYRIGCLGAGFIMRDCHLVAYRQAGFNPVALASRDPEHAREAAGRHGIARVYDTYEQVLADPEVEVVDIAVPPDAQPALIHAACRHA